jgi:hypothetical protein
VHFLGVALGLCDAGLCGGLVGERFALAHHVGLFSGPVADVPGLDAAARAAPVSWVAYFAAADCGYLSTRSRLPRSLAVPGQAGPTGADSACRIGS